MAVMQEEQSHRRRQHVGLPSTSAAPTSCLRYLVMLNLYIVHQKDIGHSPQDQTAIGCLTLARPPPKVRALPLLLALHLILIAPRVHLSEPQECCNFLPPTTLMPSMLQRLRSWELLPSCSAWASRQTCGALLAPPSAHQACTHQTVHVICIQYNQVIRPTRQQPPGAGQCPFSLHKTSSWSCSHSAVQSALQSIYKMQRRTDVMSGC